MKSKVVLVEAKGGKSLDQKAIGAATHAGYGVVKMEPSTQSVNQRKAAAKAAKK